MAFSPAEILRDMEKKFEYREPTDEQKRRYKLLGAKFLELAKDIIDITPICPDQTVALRKLHECSTAVNSTISCNE